MSLIHEINETNYVEERAKGKVELDAKFEKWDRLGRISKDLSKNEFKKLAAELWRDPTIWAYANLKDDEGNPLRLYPFQDRLINDRSRFVHIHAANQIGKTWAAAVVKGLHHLLFTDNASVMIISSKEPQSIKILDEMKWMLRRGRADYSGFLGDVDNRTELQVELRKGIVSTVRTFPPTTAILGYPATLVVIDEDNFWEKIGNLTPVEYYDQCIEPRTNATKDRKHPFLTMGQIIGISNPNGQQGLGWRCLTDPRFKNYAYNWLAKPNNTIEEYKLHKARLPSYRFASIYAATYEDVEGGFITGPQYEKFASYFDKMPTIPRGSNLYLGGDFASEDPKGKGRDWNVVYGVIQVKRVEKDAEQRLPRLRVVYMKEWKPGTDTRVVYDAIRGLKNRGINIAKFAYDKVGIGDKVANDMIDRGILSRHNIEVLTYSLPNKSDVYINFQTMFEQGLIEGSDIPKLREQIFGLKVEQPLGSVHLKIHHARESIKDDHPDALANACYAARRLIGTVPSFVGFTKSLNPQEKQISDKLYTLVCPECENEGQDGYYQGRNTKNEHLARINCPKHQLEA